MNSVMAREHILYNFSSLKVTVAYVMEQYMSICSVYMGVYEYMLCLYGNIHMRLKRMYILLLWPAVSYKSQLH